MPYQQTDAQRQNALTAAGYNSTQKDSILAGVQTSAPISVSGLTEPIVPVNVPTYAEPTPPTGMIDASIQSLLNASSPAEAQGSELQTQLMATIEKLGTKSARKAELEATAGLPAQRQQLQDVVNQLQGLQKEAAAIPLLLQQQYEGQGVTAAGLATVQADRLRENSIKSLGLAAIGQTFQGNIALADETISRAIDTEFAPQETKLKALEKLYEFNKDALVREDSKRAEKLGILLSERTRLLEIDKANKTEIYNIGKIAQQYGASSGTVQKIFAARTREEALAAAGSSLIDPKATIELENARLDTILKKAQIARTQKETALLGEQTAAEKKAEKEALEQAKTAIPLLSDKIGAIAALKTSSGLKGSVGVYGLGRFTPFTVDKAARINFIAGVEQLTSKETLDALVNLKAQGGTLGALSDGEREMLKNAASKIGTWALKDDGKVYGYEVSETDFVAELDRIQELAQRALNKARGSIFSEDEAQLLSEAFPTSMSGTTSSSLVGGLSFYQP